MEEKEDTDYVAVTIYIILMVIGISIAVEAFISKI